MKWRRKQPEELIVKFKSADDHVWNVREKPVPASKLIPEWWKNIPSYTDGANSIDLNPAPNVTVKRCQSAFDSITAGYIVPLWADIMVSYSQEFGSIIKWATKEPVVELWQKQQVAGYNLGDGYEEPVFKYLHKWLIETPPGWSSLILSPFGYPDLPFKVIPGVVDTDKLKTEINTPFVIKKGFEGIIEKGTPMFQIIPIKRSTWKSEFIKGDNQEHIYECDKLRSKIVSYYGRYLRVPKIYK